MPSGAKDGLNPPTDIEVNRRNILLSSASLIALTATSVARCKASAAANACPRPPAASGKPNILVILGDDIGIANVSAYSDGLMGYETPNIDRIAQGGLRFLHYYGEQVCTAGRVGVPHRPARHPHRADARSASPARRWA